MTCVLNCAGIENSDSEREVEISNHHTLRVMSKDSIMKKVRVGRRVLRACAVRLTSGMSQFHGHDNDTVQNNILTPDAVDVALDAIQMLPYPNGGSAKDLNNTKQTKEKESEQGDSESDTPLSILRNQLSMRTSKRTKGKTQDKRTPIATSKSLIIGTAKKSGRSLGPSFVLVAKLKQKSELDEYIKSRGLSLHTKSLTRARYHCKHKNVNSCGLVLVAIQTRSGSGSGRSAYDIYQFGRHASGCGLSNIKVELRSVKARQSTVRNTIATDSDEYRRGLELWEKNKEASANLNYLGGVTFKRKTVPIAQQQPVVSVALPELDEIAPLFESINAYSEALRAAPLTKIEEEEDQEGQEQLANHNSTQHNRDTLLVAGEQTEETPPKCCSVASNYAPPVPIKIEPKVGAMPKLVIWAGRRDTDPYQCPFCCFNRNHHKSVAQHIAETHKFICKTCKIALDSKELFDVHNQSNHSNMVFCGTCWKVFHGKSGFENHSRSKEHFFNRTKEVYIVKSVLDALEQPTSIEIMEEIAQRRNNELETHTAEVRNLMNELSGYGKDWEGLVALKFAFKNSKFIDVKQSPVIEGLFLQAADEFGLSKSVQVSVNASPPEACSSSSNDSVYTDTQPNANDLKNNGDWDPDLLEPGDIEGLIEIHENPFCDVLLNYLGDNCGDNTAQASMPDLIPELYQMETLGTDTICQQQQNLVQAEDMQMLEDTNFLPNFVTLAAEFGFNSLTDYSLPSIEPPGTVNACASEQVNGELPTQERPLCFTNLSTVVAEKLASGINNVSTVQNNNMDCDFEFPENLNQL